mmetsp:Transcript_20228/g.27900  ORF Transcript_20228/g.27900 Transcript_20228/m.27900 type:complete len:444 (+) Transcript_20228:176-1507(+)
MLAVTSHEPNESLGQCPPNYRETTVALVAANAVMAGCVPIHFPVVLAAVQAILDPQFGLHGNSATTMGATPLLVVNGPARLEAKLNFKHGALGSGTRANACIGRAVKLVMQNVGGGKLGGTESTTLGTPMKFTMCTAEWEEKATEWNPYHVERGFQPETSVVTVLTGTGGPTQIVDFYTKDADELCEMIARGMHSAYNHYLPFINDCFLVISPEHYETLVAGGIKSKEELRNRLWEKCNHDFAPSIRRLVEKKYGYWSGVALGYPLGWAARLSNLTTGKGLSILSKFESPDSFHIIVAGGPAGKFSAFCPGFGVGKPPMPTAHMSRPVSRVIEPAPSQVGEAAASFGKDLSPEAIFDPRPPTDSRVVQLAGRTGELKGPIGLLDISKPGGVHLLDRIQKRLSTNFPELEILRFTKATFSRPADPDLRSEILSKCKMIIEALAD